MDKLALKRFSIGGAGALVPLLVTLLAADLPGIIDHYHDYTVGIYIGTALRYFILFTLGGIVAALNSDVSSPVKLFQLGIAAPAVISSYVNAQAPNMSKVPSRPTTSLIFSTATAGELSSSHSERAFFQTAGFLDDVWQGAVNPLQSVKPQSIVKGPSGKEAADIKAAIARESAERAASAAKKAKEDAEAAAAKPSPDAQAAAQKSAEAASAAAKKAAEDAADAQRALQIYLTTPKDA